jgi:hypothetical protein
MSLKADSAKRTIRGQSTVALQRAAPLGRAPRRRRSLPGRARGFWPFHLSVEHNRQLGRARKIGVSMG